MKSCSPLHFQLPLKIPLNWKKNVESDRVAKENLKSHSVYIIDHPDFILCSFMENSVRLKIVRGKILEPLPPHTEEWLPI